MAKSAIYTANTTSTALTAGSAVPVGTTVRRFGQCVRQEGSSIALTAPGYYLVTASATLSPTAAGTVSITGQKDGVPISSAMAAETTAAAAASANLALTFMVRNTCCDSSVLSFVLGGEASTLTNFAVSVVKI